MRDFSEIFLDELEVEFSKAIRAGASCCETACTLYQWGNAPHEIINNKQWIKAHNQARESLKITIAIMRRYLASVKNEPVQIYQVELRERIKGASLGCRQCSRGLEMLSSSECIAAKLLEEGN